jgi:gas vesicle protein
MASTFKVRRITSLQTLKRRTEMRFLLGLMIGYGVGLLLAPASGEETRARVAENLDENARDKARQIGARAGEMAYEELKKTV